MDDNRMNYLIGLVRGKWVENPKMGPLTAEDKKFMELIKWEDNLMKEMNVEPEYYVPID